MKKFFLILSILFYSLAILNPAFYPPWASFLSEYLTFLSLLCLLPILFEKNICIPQLSVFFILISFIPIIQYSLGVIFYLDTALLSFLYIISFSLAIVVGFNSAEKYKNPLTIFYSVVLVCGLISSLIAILQWSNINIKSDFIMQTNGRPFANMAQPNHLSTFLILALISCLYFYESKILNNKILAIFSIILLITVSLTQSRTAWIIFLFLSLYWLIAYKRNILTFNYKKIGLYVLLFIEFSFLLPFLKKLLFQHQTISILDRASSGHERIQIWLQAIEAIKQQPLTGYGWNQSSFAQFETIQEGFIKHKLTSFHNIILDIIVWCGIPIGITLLLFFTYLILKYSIKSYNLSQICAVSSIGIILIHALLEFPLSYSYFLLPVGFLLGFLFFSFNEKTIKIKGFLFFFIFLLGIFLSLYLFKEYSRIPDNMIAAEAHEMNEKRDLIELPYKLEFFDTFQYRAKWISLYPCTKLNTGQLTELKYMVKTYMIHYDLYKSSEVFFYNGYINQAKKHLNILNYMYKKNYTLKDLKCSNKL